MMSAIAGRLGINRALGYALLARCWSLSAGAITLAAIARYFSIEEQGFYYTFWSVLGLWVFFDLGLSFVVVQFASHERATLQFREGAMHGEHRARQRLASLLRLAVQWYSVAGLLMLVIVLPLGLIFFGRYERPGSTVAWVGPWILVVGTSAFNLVIGPFAAMLEGSGLLQDIALMRLLQAVTANVLFWVSLVAGADLYAAVVLNGTMAAFNATWILARHRRFFDGLWSVVSGDQAIRWRDDVWPFQWRFAISWMTGYFMFQIFTPILFATRGADAAGQMGMSLMVTTAIALFAQSWISTSAVDYGSLVASRNYKVLDRVFRRSLIQSTAVITALSVCFLLGVEALRQLGHPLSGRLLSPLPLALLIGATILNHIVGAEAAYLRAHKREPFLGIYVTTAIATIVVSLLVAARFGATGMLAGLFVAVGVIGVGMGTAVFLASRRSWQNAASIDAAGRHTP
jgi:hypothetical protein